MAPIVEWLRILGLEKYYATFQENAVELDILADLTEQDFAEMGVALGDRKRIMRAARELAPKGVQTPAAGAERRILTVFFSDLVGSTGLAQTLDVEELRSVLGAYQAICRSEILRFEGQVARTFGDGVLAYFGYPLAHEDDAERAASAGLAIIERMKAMETPGDAKLQVRIGLASGAVIVEDMISGHWADETATGRTINLATRIQEQAQSNSILVDEATRANLQRAFRCASAGERRLKGFSDAVPLWTIEGPEDARTRFEAAYGAQTIPLQGRRREFADLGELWRNVAAGNGKSVLLNADAGMGKSRLLHEFHRSLDGVRMLVGECVSYGAQTPYLPIINMLGRFARIKMTDTPGQKRAALETALAGEAVPANALEPICLMFGLSDAADEIMQRDSSERQQKIVDAVLGLICAMARSKPLIVAVEDAHWIDPASEALLAALSARTGSASLLFVCTHRPGYIAPWLRVATQIQISPLNRSESEHFIAAVLGANVQNKSVLGLVAEKAQGNPLFMQELARAIGAAGHDAGLPSTVHSVLMARIDKLPRAARNLLQIASVLGREFHLRLVEQLWNSAERLDFLLSELMRLQLIYERIEVDERILVFSHALIQDAAYESLLKSRRQEMHRQAAQAIEKLFPGSAPTMASVLAHHYASGGDAANAIGYQIVAADRALQAYALAEAESLLRQALGLAQSLPRNIGFGHRISAAMRLSQALYLAGRFDESVDAVEREADILLAGEPASATAPCLFWLAHMLARRTRYDEARRYARAAISQAEAIGDDVTVGKSLGLLCLVDLLSDKAHRALTVGIQSREYLARAGEASWMGMSEFYLGMANIVLGRLDDAIANAGRALSTGETINDRRLCAYALFLRGWACAAGRRFAEASVDCARALEFAPDPTSRCYASGFLAISWLGAGHTAKAVPALREASKNIVQIGYVPFEILFAAWLAEGERLAGDLQTAEATALAAVSRAEACPYPYGEAHARRALGNIRAAQGQSGVEDWQRAVHLFKSIGSDYEAQATRP